MSHLTPAGIHMEREYGEVIRASDLASAFLVGAHHQVVLAWTLALKEHGQRFGSVSSPSGTSLLTLYVCV